MEGLIGKKVGMTQVFVDGKRICVTVLEVGPCPVVQVKTLEKDGYVAAQLGFGEQKKQRLTKAVAGHQEKTGGLTDKKVRVLKEFALDEGETVKAGDVLTVSNFEGVKYVDELEVLVYHAYSQIERILGRADDNLFPVNGDLPLVGEVYAGEHIHKRGLAGAVFAQQSQYLASVYIQPYLIVGKHRAEGLGDIAHFYRRGFLLHFFSPNIFWSKLLQRAARRLKSLCCPLEQ